ncbi:hypothetical protein D9M72_532040 [compost metagenome]
MRRLGQVVKDDHDVGRLAGRGGTACTHGDSDVGHRQDGGVVDAVAHHHHGTQRKGLHRFHFVRRQALGTDVREAHLGGDVLGRGQGVAGQHHRFGDPQRGQLSQRPAGLGAQRVAHDQGPDVHPADADVDCQLAADQFRFHDAGRVLCHEGGLAHHDFAAVEHGAHPVRGMFECLAGGLEPEVA